MQTFFHSVFAGRIQGKRIVARCGGLVPAVLALGLVLPFAPAALADGIEPDAGTPPSSYGPPPAPPAGSRTDDDTPRRDIHMGTVDHMRMGRDEEGNVIMEVRPRPKKVEQQPTVGPFYIYPQIGSPNRMPMATQQGTGQSGTGGAEAAPQQYQRPPVSGTPAGGRTGGGQ